MCRMYANFVVESERNYKSNGKYLRFPGTS